MLKKIAILSFVLFLLSSCTKDIKPEGQFILTKINLTVVLEGEELQKNEKIVDGDFGSLIKSSSELKDFKKEKELKCKKNGDSIVLYATFPVDLEKIINVTLTFKGHENNTRIECDNPDGIWEMVKIKSVAKVTMPQTKEDQATLDLKKEGSFTSNKVMAIGPMGNWKQVDNIITFTSTEDSGKVLKTTALKGEGDDYFRLKFPYDSDGLPATATLSFSRK